MKMMTNKTKIFCVFNFLVALIFSGCTPECPSIESVIDEGDTVNISMIECGSSSIVFELTLDLKVLENFNNNQISEKYVHIPKESIEFKKHENFDYKIYVSSREDLTFVLLVKMSEGNNIEIEGNDSKRMKKDKSEITFGWTTAFKFFGSIQELEKGVYQTEIESEKRMNTVELERFNRAVANFNEKYSFVLSISK